MRRTLHAEWTKFRTVRGWVLGAVGAALASVLFLLVATVSTNQHAGDAAPLPLGPGGEAVNDSFTFLHRTLLGDGSLTVPVTALTGVLADPDAGPHAGPGGHRPGVTPWAKAGIILKSGLTPGSRYAAVTTTGAHGVRLQSDFVLDRAGDLTGVPTAAAPQWLRLVRAGTTVTGYECADGVRWTLIGSVTLPAGPLEAGLFVTSPAAVTTAGGGGSYPATATGSFGRPVTSGAWKGSWAGVQVGDGAGTSGSPVPGASAGYRPSGAGFVLTGAGDIAPVVGGPAGGPAFSVETFLVGTFVGLLVLGVVAVQFATGEYRRGLLGLSLAATPHRCRVLAAKAAVVGSVGFIVGAGAAGLSLPLGLARAKAAHFTVLTVPTAVELRVVLGTGLLLASTAVLAVALGVLMRRSAAALTVLVAATVLPYLLAVGGMLPAGPAQWLLRLTPAAGFAAQHALPRYGQVLSVYAPASGYFPLSAWAGLAVLVGWTLVALAAASLALRLRSA